MSRRYAESGLFDNVKTSPSELCALIGAIYEPKTRTNLIMTLFNG
jgi:hypothetical protein